MAWPIRSRTGWSYMATVSQTKRREIGASSARHTGPGIHGANGGGGIPDRSRTQRVAVLSSKTVRHMWSQYDWKSSQVSGTGRMLMPYWRYQVLCSSNNVRLSSSVIPPQKCSAVRIVPTKKVACAQ